MEHIVLLLFSFFTEAVILWQYAASLFSPSHSGKKRLTLLSVLYVLLFFLSLLGQTWLNIISFFVINTVFLYIMFNLKLLLALFHSAILTAIMGISELAVLGMISRFFPHFLLEASVGLVFIPYLAKLPFCSRLLVKLALQGEQSSSRTVRSLRNSLDVHPAFLYSYDVYSSFYW